MRPTVPTEIPEELKAAWNCPAALDPDWPVAGPLHALELLTEWDELIGQPTSIADHIFRLTHAHAYELEDLAKFGHVDVYRKSLSTKYISISWHLAGRFSYDDELVRWLVEHKHLNPCFFDENGVGRLNDKPGDPFFTLRHMRQAEPGYKKLRLVDFGAACWVQAIFYAKKGLDVTVINSSLDSDANRFGRWLAQKSGLPDGTIREYASDDQAWGEQTFDVVYAVDVLEHVPPHDDGTPGWIPYAEALLKCLSPSGIWYANAPLEIAPGKPRPVEHHPVHFSSPIGLPEWERDHGLVERGCFLRVRG